MNMKKVIASVIAGAVAVSAMATSAFADTESVLKTFKTNDETYTGTATFTGTVTAADVDVTFTLPDPYTKADEFSVDSVTIAGTKYEGDDADVYATVDAVGKVTITPVSIEAGKAISVTITAKNTDDTDVFDNDDFDGLDKSKITDAVSGGFKTYIFKSKTNKVAGDKVYMEITDDAANIDYIGMVGKKPPFKGITATIANNIGANKGAKLVFSIKDLENAEEDGEDDPTYTQKATFADATAQDLGIMLNGTSKLSTAAEIDKDAMTVTFDWDTLLKNSNITNAIGEVTTIEIIGDHELVKKYDSNNDGTKDKYKYAIESIKVVVPDAAATTEAPATEAPADDTTTTTPADKNPPTGAAPVALALIPAALAAVVVAKKRK